jgi:hypothetical protein
MRFTKSLALLVLAVSVVIADDDAAAGGAADAEGRAKLLVSKQVVGTFRARFLKKNIFFHLFFLSFT